MFDKINILKNKNNQNDQNEGKEIGPKIFPFMDKW